jgi:transposase
VSRLDGELEVKAAAGRRIEVITGGGGRWCWSEDEKARAIEASLAPGVVVSEVARLHGISAQQLFAWHREPRRRFVKDQDFSQLQPKAVVLIIGQERP